MGGIVGKKGCEQCFTTVSLLEYAKNFLSKQDYMYAEAQLQKNQDNLDRVQEQIDPDIFL